MFWASKFSLGHTLYEYLGAGCHCFNKQYLLNVSGLFLWPTDRIYYTFIYILCSHNVMCGYEYDFDLISIRFFGSGRNKMRIF